MKRPQKKRGPVAATTKASKIASGATVQSTYFSNGPIGKENDLVNVPRIWIEIAVQLLIDALDNSDRRELPEDSL